MNLDGQLSVQDFTTLERVKALYTPSIDTGDLDALIATLIGDVSARFVRFLGLHALRVERTELYEVRRFAKIVSLDAKPIDGAATFTVDYGADTGTGLSLITTQSFILNKAAGWLRLLFETRADPGYVRVKYTGGLGTTVANLITAWPDLAGAADRQVIYLLQRRGMLGGNVTVPMGGGTSFEGQYGLLKEVENVLAQHRRAA